MQTIDSEGNERAECLRIDLSKTAIILIDVWRTHEKDMDDDGWLRRKHANIQFKIVPLLTLARHYGMTIIHAPHRLEIAEEARPLPGEVVSNPSNPKDSREALLPYLREHQITTLIYAGYTSNLCLLYRPVGMIAMRDMGYQTILLQDCTVPFIPNESVNEQEILKVVKPLWGTTTTLDLLQKAFQRHA